jgi:hypothetical protein
MYQASILSCTYLAHHELESIELLIFIIITCTAAVDEEHIGGHWPAWQSVVAAGLCLRAGHILYAACLVK